MKKQIIIVLVMLLLILTSCDGRKPTSDMLIQKKSEKIMQEGNRRLGLPAIVNFQEKKNLKWIYELCDQENFICYAYLANTMTGEVGQFLGKCVGYGIPYSTQFSNPEKFVRVNGGGGYGEDKVTKQAEPNGLFKPEGLSATWLIMIDPETKKPRPVYIEPQIIVSPFKLK